MAEISFRQRSPAGNAVVDSARLLIAPNGDLFWRAVDGAPTPVPPEQRDALAGHFGRTLDAALRAVAALS
jgi:hypothetical protein